GERPETALSLGRGAGDKPGKQRYDSRRPSAAQTSPGDDGHDASAVTVSIGSPKSALARSASATCHGCWHATPRARPDYSPCHDSPATGTGPIYFAILPCERPRQPLNVARSRSPGGTVSARLAFGCGSRSTRTPRAAEGRSRLV